MAVAGGGGVALCNSRARLDGRLSENHWRIDVDLRSNIAAEARAKIVYERLINFCDDAGTKDALQFLMTREIAHMKSFSLALETLISDPLEVGKLGVDEQEAHRYYNDSTGEDSLGGKDAARPLESGQRLGAGRGARLQRSARFATLGAGRKLCRRSAQRGNRVAALGTQDPRQFTAGGDPKEYFVPA